MLVNRDYHVFVTMLNYTPHIAHLYKRLQEHDLVIANDYVREITYCIDSLISIKIW